MHNHSHDNDLVALLLIALVCGLAIAAYTSAMFRQYLLLRNWHYRRYICFIIGVLLLAVAFLPALEQLSHRHFTTHMMQHLLIGMFAPIALVMSAPLTLLLRSLPTSTAKSLIGVLHLPFFYWLSHPAITLLLNIGGMYLLYFTPLYQLSLTDTAVHYFVHWHFLLAGYLFAWSIVGPDPIPNRPSFMFRTVILLISIAAHSLLAKLIYIEFVPLGAEYPPAMIQRAAKIMYYGGDLAELILAALFFRGLYRHSGSTHQPEKCKSNRQNR